MCNYPITAWYSAELTVNGLRKLVFNKTKSDGTPSIKIPCGQCTGCRISRTSDWSVRLMHESRYHAVSSFLTLTLDPHHYPANGSLDKSLPRGFMRRLRKHYKNIDPELKIRYFAVGEYGETTGRAHYHMILFGVGFLEDRRPHSKNAQGDQMYTSATLDKLWGKGQCLIGNVSPQSCGYVAGYAFKKINGSRADDHYRRVDPETGETWVLQKEFAGMSNHPGIGFDFYQDYHQQTYLRDSVIVKGRQRPVPKYYDRKLKESDPEWLERIKAERMAKAELHKEDQTPERLQVKEEILLAKRREYHKPTL